MRSTGERRLPIEAVNLGKKYTLFERPSGRLLHMLSGGRWGNGRDFWALQNISFEVRPGETLGIVGANGSGKSTLLQLIAGTLKASTGEVSTRGRVAALLELGAGFNPELTGRENVILSCALHGLHPEQVKQRLPAIETFAEIGDFIHQPVKQYSSGMFVRLAFAVIAHVDADVLIVDEALAVGDVYYQQKCMRFMHAFMARGTVLFVSHDMASVKSLCSQVLWLERGQLVDIGSPKSIGDAYLKGQYARGQPVNRVAESSAAATDPIGSGRPRSEKPSQTLADGRVAAMQKLGLENRIELFQFDASHEGFGVGDARIILAEMRGEHAEVISSVCGGEQVSLRILAHVVEQIKNPIFGFFLRNRLGLNVFGDNTALTYQGQHRVYSQGTQLEALFEFVMPFLPRGDYSLCVAIATGTNANHIQQHWVNEAFLLKSVSNDVHADVLGIPMNAISIREVDDQRKPVDA